MGRCMRCGKQTEEILIYDGQELCRLCWKKQDLKDQRDWEDDPVRNESEE